MKVLIVSNMYPERNPNFQYAGIFVKEQYEALSSCDGVECDLFIIDGFKSKFVYLSSSFSVLLRIIFGRYDVIHAHYGLSALFTLLLPFKKWSKVVLTLHGGDILVEQGKRSQVWLTKKILSRVGKVITLNDKMNDVVSTIRTDYTVLPCGIDTVLFRTEEDVIRKNVVIFPGSKDRAVKNYQLFAKIIEVYSAKYGELTPLVMDGLDRPQVRGHMSGSVALLMTSISEGSPQAIKEAMGCDMAIVSTDVGDVRSVLGGVSGTAVFDIYDDPEQVAAFLHKAIIEASNTAGLRRARIVSLGLDNKDIVIRLMELYREVSNDDA